MTRRVRRAAGSSGSSRRPRRPSLPAGGSVRARASQSRRARRWGGPIACGLRGPARTASTGPSTSESPSQNWRGEAAAGPESPARREARPPSRWAPRRAKLRSRRPSSTVQPYRFAEAVQSERFRGSHQGDPLHAADGWRITSLTIVTDPPQHDITLRLISPIPLSSGASPFREALDERCRQDHLQGPHLPGNRVTPLLESRSVPAGH